MSQTVAMLGLVSAFCIPMFAPWVSALLWRPRHKWRAVVLCSVLTGASYAVIKIAFFSLALGKLPPNLSIMGIAFFVVGLGCASLQHAAFDQPQFRRSYSEDAGDIGDASAVDGLAFDLALDDVVEAAAALGLNNQLATMTPRVVHQAWAKRAADCHPDCGGDSAEFRRITEARDLLLKMAAC